MSKKIKAHTEPTPEVDAPAVDNPAVTPEAVALSTVADEVVAEVIKPKAILTPAKPASEAERIPLRTLPTIGGNIRRDY